MATSSESNNVNSNNESSSNYISNNNSYGNGNDDDDGNDKGNNNSYSFSSIIRDLNIKMRMEQEEKYLPSFKNFHKNLKRMDNYTDDLEARFPNKFRLEYKLLC